MGRASSRKQRHRKERAARKRTAIAAQRAGETRGCLVCRSDDGGFVSREHPLPESLGNTEITLPSGVVCDRCNNGPLAVLDQGVCEFLPVKMRRTMLGVNSKAGCVPSTRFQGGTVEHTGPASLRFTGDGGRRIIRETFRSRDTVGLEFSVGGGRRMTPRYGSELSRALLKIGLELAWLDHGPMMLEGRFDHIRAAILGSPRRGFFLMALRGDPAHTAVSITYDLVRDGADWRMWIVGKLFGVALATDSRLAVPPVDVSELAMVLSFDPQDFKAA